MSHTSPHFSIFFLNIKCFDFKYNNIIHPHFSKKVIIHQTFYKENIVLIIIIPYQVTHTHVVGIMRLILLMNLFCHYFPL